MEDSTDAVAAANLTVLPNVTCPSSPPPDAVWTLERILQNPPQAPKKRHHARLPPPRHRRSLSNIPSELLSAWPTNVDSDDDISDDDENALNPPVLLSPSSGSFSPSSSSSSNSLSPTCFRASLHPHRPTARGAVADTRLLFQHHSTSQLYVRPAHQVAQKHGRLLSSSSSTSTVLFVSNHNNSADSHHPGELWEEDRQGSTRHLFERTGGWTSSPTHDDSNSDDDWRTS